MKPLFKTPGKKGSQRGFTVLESIIAFALLSLTLSGFAGMMVSSLHNFRNSQNKYLAAMIAQEGMELAQNKKDSNEECTIEDPNCPISDWQQNLSGDYEVDATQPNQLLPGHQFANYNPTDYICIVQSPPQSAGKFGYCGSSATAYLSPQFTREVKITPVNAYTVSVVTTVRWNGNQSLVLQSLLFNDAL